MRLPERIYDTRIAKILFLSILVVGFGLRLYQYLMGRSLWHDEAHLAMNFANYGFNDLTKPLGNYQSAPIFFLFSVEAFTRVFGLGELALRAAPFLFSVIALPLFFWFVRDLTKSSTIALLAFFIFSINISLIYYSSEIKPYTVDVSIFVVIGYLTVSENDFVIKRKTVLLSIAGCLAILFSNASPMVLACVFIYLLWQSVDSNDNRNVLSLKKLMVVSFCWILVFAGNYFKFIYNHPYGETMKEVWSSTFCPTRLFSPEFNDFFRQRFEEIFFSGMLYFNKSRLFCYTVLLFALTGIGNIISTRRYKVLLFTLTPVLLHLFVSMLRLYPFHQRFILYLLPAIIILISIGLGVVAKALSQKTHWSIAALVVGFCLFHVSEQSFRQFPKWDIKIKPALVYIDRNYPHTKLLITTPFSMYEFYNKTGFVKNPNFDRIAWDLSPEQFLDLEVVKSQRSNFVMLHSNIGGDNTDMIIAKLKNRGMIVSQYFNNDFAVTEIRPATNKQDTR